MATSTSEDFTVQTDPFRRELLAHCYRMLGSVHDAEDLLQETLLRAWRAYDQYDPSRASLRTWLYRIATNACLTALEQRSRRPLPSGLGAPPNDDPDQPLIRGEEVPWLQPIPDAMLGDPAGVLLSRGSLRLAFVAAMQFLPARQRAVLILREVLRWQATEVAELLDTTVASVNSALQRARATLAEADVDDLPLDRLDDEHQALLERYVTLFESYDIASLVTLLHDDCQFTMPPHDMWLQGHDDIAGWMLGPGIECKDGRLLPIPGGANGCPAFASYRQTSPGVWTPWSVVVLELSGGKVSTLHNFLYPDRFPDLGLPTRLTAEDQRA